MAQLEPKLTLNAKEWHRTRFYEWQSCHSFLLCKKDHD